MFNKFKKKILREVLDELRELKEEYDNINEVKEDMNDLTDFDIGIGSGIRKAIGKVYEMLYDNVMTKERAERKFGITIVEDEVYSKEIL